MVFQRLLSQQGTFASSAAEPRCVQGHAGRHESPVARGGAPSTGPLGFQAAKNRDYCIEIMEIYGNLYGKNRNYMDIYWKYIWKYMEIIGMDHYECN